MGSSSAALGGLPGQRFSQQSDVTVAKNSAAHNQAFRNGLTSETMLPWSLDRIRIVWENFYRWFLLWRWMAERS